MTLTTTVTVGMLLAMYILGLITNTVISIFVFIVLHNKHANFIEQFMTKFTDSPEFLDDLTDEVLKKKPLLLKLHKIGPALLKNIMTS